MEGLIAMVEISQTNKGTKSIAQTRRSRRYALHCINTPGFHAYYMKTRFIQACLSAAKAGEDSSQMQRWTCGATKPSQHLATAFRLQRSSIQFHLQLLRCPWSVPAGTSQSKDSQDSPAFKLTQTAHVKCQTASQRCYVVFTREEARFTYNSEIMSVRSHIDIGAHVAHYFHWILLHITSIVTDYES